MKAWGSVAAIAIALAALALAGCTSASDDTPPASQEVDADGVPINRIQARYATALTRDLESLLASADAYFVGEVIGEGGQRSVSLGGGERSVPVSEFLVRVDRSGGTPAEGSIITLEQIGGLAETDGGFQRLLLKRDTPLAVGEAYLFIATGKAGENYSASAFARFPVESGRLAAPAHWTNVGTSVELAGLTVDEAMERLRER